MAQLLTTILDHPGAAYSNKMNTQKDDPFTSSAH
jgi:hypothetical protein